MVDCTGLENRQRETVREFESHRFRQLLNEHDPFEAFFISTHHLDYQPQNVPLTVACKQQALEVRI